MPGPHPDDLPETGSESGVCGLSMTPHSLDLRRLRRRSRDKPRSYKGSHGICYFFPFTTNCAGASPRACQFGRYMDSTCGGGTR